MTTMKAAVLEKVKSIKVKDVDKPSPKSNEVLIKVKCIGVCGSDIHYYEDGKIGDFVVKSPIILGHELAGEVVEVGESVLKHSVGDRVAVEPGIPCGTCEQCKEGTYNLCPDVIFMATPPVDGAWAEYVTVKEDYAFKLPDNISFEEGALLEPLSVGLHAMNRASVTYKDSVLITGLGPIGILAIYAAKISGVKEIYVSDTVSYRRDFAKSLGVTAAYNPMEIDIEKEINKNTNNKGVNVVIETSGNPHAITNTVNYVRKNGRIVYIGMSAENNVPLDFSKIIDSELNIFGLFRYRNTYESAIKAIEGLNIDQIVTKKYSLAEVEEAIQESILNKDENIKIMIYPEFD